MERLFYMGLILMLLSFGELYVSTAHYEISKDRTASTINFLLPLIESKRASLEAAYQEKISPRRVAPELSADEQRRYAATRKALGLPPPLPKSSNTEGQPEGYDQLLGEMAVSVITSNSGGSSETSRFIDGSLSPSDIVKNLLVAKAEIEGKPMSVWGIQAPRAISIEYAGVPYQFPYEFLASILVIVLSLLTAVWAGSLMMTRQRELMEILREKDFKLVFPHVLNVLPVRFERFVRVSVEEQKKAEVFTRIVQAVTRSATVSVLVGPIIFALSYSLINLLTSEEGASLLLFFPASFLLIFVTVQLIAMVSFEAFVLKDKLFIER